MDTAQKLTPDLILDARCKMLGKIEPFKESYMLRYSWDDSDLAHAYLTRADIRSHDPRLIEVFDALLAKNNKIEASLVKFTVSVLWGNSFKRHVLDPELAQPGSDRMHNWRLNKLLDIEHFPKQARHVAVRLEIYRESKTDSGLTYASAVMQTALVRSFEWLDSHYRGGSGLLAFGESMGMSREELAACIQEQYIPQLKVMSEAPEMPSDIGPN